MKKKLLAERQSEQGSQLHMLNNIGNNTFEKLYLNHFDELLFIAYNLVGNEQEAEDVVASLFEKLMSNVGMRCDLYFEESNHEILGYLKISVRNACFDILRSRKRKLVFFLRLAVAFNSGRNQKSIRSFKRMHLK